MLLFCAELDLFPVLCWCLHSFPGAATCTWTSLNEGGYLRPGPSGAREPCCGFARLWIRSAAFLWVVPRQASVCMFVCLFSEVGDRSLSAVFTFLLIECFLRKFSVFSVFAKLVIFSLLFLSFYWLWVFFVGILLIKALTEIVGNSASACGSRLGFALGGPHGHY